MDVQPPASNGFTPDARTLPRSPYAKRMLSLEIGDRFWAALSRRSVLSVMATRWGRSTGRRFVTRKVRKRLVVERVA